MNLKNIKYTTLLLLAIVGFSSCEDVIEVELPENESRLVIDALVRIDTSISLNNVRVKVTTTSSFFESIVPANVDEVALINLDNPEIPPQILTEESIGSGIYVRLIATDQLVNNSWFLKVTYEDKLFVAEAKFTPSVPIDNLEIGEGGGFGGDETEIIITYTDQGNREDYYLFDFDFVNYLASDDGFYNGQTFSFSYFYDEELEDGQEVEISIMGIDEDFFNYMNLLLEQSEGGFGPFETPAVTVRGNIINALNIDANNNFENGNTVDNFALGYFAIVQEFKDTIIIE